MNSKLLPVIGVVAILIVAGAAAYVFTNSNDSNDDGITIKDLAATGNYLKIFGNANGDYLLDETDIAIIQDYIDGKIVSDDLLAVKENDHNKAYYLADSNCDGTVD